MSITHIKRRNSNSQTMSQSQPSKWIKLLDITEPFIVGAFSGVTSMFATCVIQPIDMIKVSIQLKSQESTNHSIKISPFSVAKQIYDAQGMRGFYRGLDSALVRQVIYSSTRFGVYKSMVQFTKKRNHKLGKKQISFFQRIYCSLTAGFIGSLVANPADLILVRMQADAKLPLQQRRNYNNILNGCRRVMKQQGFFGLWRGATPTVIRAMALNLGMLVSYDEIKQRLTKYLQIAQETTKLRLYISLISGLFASFISLPFDNAKTKMQKMKLNPDGSFPYKNIFDAILKTIKYQGFTHLWVGFPTFYCRIAPHISITLVSQDLLSDFFKKIRNQNY